MQQRRTDELRATSMETKPLQLAALMALAGEEWRTPPRATENDAVRDRWMAPRRTKLGM